MEGDLCRIYIQLHGEEKREGEPEGYAGLRSGSGDEAMGPAGLESAELSCTY